MRSWTVLLAALGWVAIATPHRLAAQATWNPWHASRPENLRLGLVTFGPGDGIAPAFGHNALIVEDPVRAEVHLYNFGMFSFGKDMLPKYLMGRLTFWVADLPVEATFARYEANNRSVHVQELNLAPAQRAEIAATAARSALPENREYLYDHYHDNCSTRLRDIIDRAVGGQFHQALDRPARLTYRGHTRRYAQSNPAFEFALTFWMNDSMERPLNAWDELFLPQELERAVDRLRYVDGSGHRVPLVSAKRVVFEAGRPPVSNWPATRWPHASLLGCIWGALFILAARAMRRGGGRLARVGFGVLHALLGLTFGLLGTLGFLMWTLTEHSVTYRNENQWLANPITLLALPLGIAIALGSAAGLRLARGFFGIAVAMVLLLCGMKVLPSFDQDTALPMALLAPIYLGGLWAHHQLARADATDSALPSRREAPVHASEAAPAHDG